MNYEELEKKVFDFKFPFVMIANVILFLQKIQQMHPDKSNAVNKASTQCIDEIVDQLSDEDLESMNIFLASITLENSFKKEIKDD
tara:strand:- start:1 stop:255 length:255 start_codon:yes stop_codon:yes gene_type:complete